MSDYAWLPMTSAAQLSTGRGLEDSLVQPDQLRSRMLAMDDTPRRPTKVTGALFAISN
jgi:hypothetical protein